MDANMRLLIVGVLVGLASRWIAANYPNYATYL